MVDGMGSGMGELADQQARDFQSRGCTGCHKDTIREYCEGEEGAWVRPEGQLARSIEDQLPGKPLNASGCSE